MITAALVFMPVSIYGYLTAGADISGAAVLLIIILFGELLRSTGSPFSKQELFIILEVVGGIAATPMTFYWLIYRSFLVISPFFQAAILNGVSLSSLMPYWLVPPLGSSAYVTRTFIQPDWFMPILIIVIGYMLGVLAEFSLGMIVSYMFIEVETLSWPLAAVDAEMVTTLSERESESMKMFLISLTIGAAVGFLVFGLNLVGTPLVPIPWIDLTPYTQSLLPGSAFGLSTNPAVFAFGFLLPIGFTACMLAGSFATWIIGNNLFLTVFSDVFPAWKATYFQGMTLIAIQRYAYISVWFVPHIGFILCLAIFLTAKYSKSIIRTFKSLGKVKIGMDQGYLPLPLLLIMFFSGTGGFVVLTYLLIPEIPFYIIALYSIGLSFTLALVAAMLKGELALTLNTPPIWPALLYFSQYSGISGWIFYPLLALGSQGWLPQATMAAKLTGTKVRDLYKALIVASLLSFVIGFIFMNFFWGVASIPSTIYPYTMIDLPSAALTTTMLATGVINMNLQVLFGSMGIAGLVCVVGYVLNALIHLPLFGPYALITGFTVSPPFSIMMFAGSLLGNLYLSRVLGKTRWTTMRYRIVAGIMAGIGIVVGIGISLSIIGKASWIQLW
jgi:hypothetical protein